MSTISIQEKNGEKATKQHENEHFVCSVFTSLIPTHVRAGYPIRSLCMANVALVRDDAASPVLSFAANYVQRSTEMQAVFLLRFDLRAQTYDLAREPIIRLQSTHDYFWAEHNGICHFGYVANGGWTVKIYDVATRSSRRNVCLPCLLTAMISLYSNDNLRERGEEENGKVD